MEKVSLFCSECGDSISETDPFLQGPDHQGQFLCEPCFHGTVDEAQWHHSLTVETLADLLNQADYYRWTQFCVSFIGGSKGYIVAKECYPSVFSILTTRDDLVRIISEKTGS